MKTVKTLLRILTTNATVLACFYGFGALANGSWHPNEWTPFSRGLWGTVAAFVGIIASFFITLSAEE